MKTEARQPQLRTKCPACGERRADSSYKGRVQVTRAWDGNSTRDYHVFACGQCGEDIRQEVGR